VKLELCQLQLQVCYRNLLEQYNKMKKMLLTLVKGYHQLC
jgi:hypothetical protein